MQIKPSLARFFLLSCSIFGLTACAVETTELSDTGGSSALVDCRSAEAPCPTGYQCVADVNSGYSCVSVNSGQSSGSSNNSYDQSSSSSNSSSSSSSEISNVCRIEGTCYTCQSTGGCGPTTPGCARSSDPVRDCGSENVTFPTDPGPECVEVEEPCSSHLDCCGDSTICLDNRCTDSCASSDDCYSGCCVPVDITSTVTVGACVDSSECSGGGSGGGGGGTSSDLDSCYDIVTRAAAQCDNLGDASSGCYGLVSYSAETNQIDAAFEVLGCRLAYDGCDLSGLLDISDPTPSCLLNECRAYWSACLDLSRDG